MQNRRASAQGTLALRSGNATPRPRGRNVAGDTAQAVPHAPVPWPPPRPSMRRPGEAQQGECQAVGVRVPDKPRRRRPLGLLPLRRRTRSVLSLPVRCWSTHGTPEPWRLAAWAAGGRQGGCRGVEQHSPAPSAPRHPPPPPPGPAQCSCRTRHSRPGPWPPLLRGSRGVTWHASETSPPKPAKRVPASTLRASETPVAWHPPRKPRRRGCLARLSREKRAL